jgi:type II secretory pathway pseudopilin PulG
VPGRGPEAGFSLVAVIAGMTVMLILMGAAMPSWKYVVKNDREQELYFRGDQIASAIERYQKKHGGPPPTLEVLVKGKFLRKEYTDPMTRDGKWKFIRVGEVAISGAGALPARPPGTSVPTPSPIPRPGMGMGASGQIGSPFIGVASTSEDASLREMNGQDHYNEWLFVAGRPRVLGRDGPLLPGGNASPSRKPPSPAQTK